MKNNIILKKLIASAILAAMAIVLNKLSIKIGPSLQITLYGLPLIISSIILGIKCGAISGLITGLITQTILSEYGITPTVALWMIAPILWGILPSLFIKLPVKNRMLKIGISTLLTAIIITLINTLVIYLDGLIIGYPTGLTLGIIFMRILSSILTCIIYIPVTIILDKHLSNIIK